MTVSSSRPLSVVLAGLLGLVASSCGGDKRVVTGNDLTSPVVDTGKAEARAGDKGAGEARPAVDKGIVDRILMVDKAIIKPDSARDGMKSDGTVTAKSCRCATNADCAAITGGIYKFCSVNKTCIACKADVDCPTSPKKCNTATGFCKLCAVDADCTALGMKKCNTTSGTCLMCVADADCTTGVKKCNTNHGICKFCAADADCVVSGTKIVTGKCDPVTGQCLKCTSDADCGYTGSVTTICGPAQTCIMCKADADCASRSFKGCDPAIGYCSICTSNAQCATVFPGGTALQCK